MLSDQSKGIQKLIFERICQIHDEILIHDPEYIVADYVSSSEV